MNRFQGQKHICLNNQEYMPLLGLGVYDLYDQEAERVISEALEIGYRLIDTASMYKNEKEVGLALKKSGLKREDFFITTKVANTDQGFENTIRAFEHSLDLLGLDYVDLYLIHWPIRSHRKESWQALEKIFLGKRAKGIGVANYPIPILEELRSHSFIKPVLNQVEFSPWLYQKELLEYSRAHQIQLQSYCPITRGIKLNDPRLLALSKKYDRTPAQMVLRWNIEQGISTIPKTSHKSRLKENFESLNFEIQIEDWESMNSYDEGFRICEDPMDFY